MNGVYILDTSVVVKWFSSKEEKDVDKACKLRELHLNQTLTFVVPELLYYELGNALRYNPNFTSRDVIVAMESVFKLGLETRKIDFELTRDAVALAYRLDITTYDACFLSLAQRLNASLITADYSFFKKAKSSNLVTALSEMGI